MASKTLTLTKIHHPFDRRDRDTLVYEYCGAPLSEIRGALPTEVEFAISINGQVVPDEHLALVIPQPGDHVVFCPRLSGGNDGKMIGRVIGMLVVAVAAIYTGGLAGATVGTFFGTSAAVGATMVGAAIGIIGGVLVGAVFAPKPPGTGAIASNAYSWNPQTVQQQGLPLPKWYGTNKLTGNIISSYRSDASAADQYINALISLGMGPLAINTPANILINNQPYTNFLNSSNGPAIQCQIRQGKLDQPAMLGFEAVHTDYIQSVEIVYGSPFTYTTVGDAFDSLDIEIAFPNGIFSINSSGGYDTSSVAIGVEISPHGANTWRALATTADVFDPTAGGALGRWSKGYYAGVDPMGGGGGVWTETTAGSSDPADHVEGDLADSGGGFTTPLYWHWLPPLQPVATAQIPYVTVNGNSTTAIRQNVTSGQLPHGKYDLRVTRVDNNNPSYVTMYLSNVSEVTNSSLTYPRQAMVGIQALASSSISGSFQFSVVADCALIRVYDGTSWSVIFNNNPAWVLWDVLTQPVFDNSLNVLRYDGIDPALIDLAAFETLAAWLDTPVPDGKGGTEPRMTFNGGFDADATLWDCALQVCQVAGCAVIPTGTGYTLSIEMPSEPVQLFSMGNIVQGSFKETFLAMEDRAAEITVSYLDQDQNYSRTELAVINPNIATIANKVNVQCIGVAKASEGWRLASRQLAINELILRTVEFRADIDAIACTVGDVVNFSHDVPQWGFSGRLVAATSTTVELDKEVTLAPDTAYSVMVRLSDDTVVTRTVATGAGTTNSLTVSTPFGVVPEQYDVYAFGISGIVTKPLRVISIKRNGDLQADIITTEYNESIYDIDGGAPALPTINYSELITYVVISGLGAAEQIEVNEAGIAVRSLTVSWAASGASAIRFDIFIRQQGLPWQQAGSTGDSAFSIQGTLPDTTYEIMVVGLNAAGQATPYVSAPIFTIVTSSTTTAVSSLFTVPDVTGLELFGQGNDTEFVGRDVNLDWRKVSPVMSTVVGDSAAPNQPLVWFRYYELKIFTLGGALRRTEYLVNEAYGYSFEKNWADGNGIVSRDLYFELRAVSTWGGVSQIPATLTASNPAPAVLAVQLTAGVEQFTVDFNPSGESDVIAGGGYEVFAVTADELVAGDFVPASNNRLYKGANTNIILPAAAGIWGVKVAAYDVFGDTGLNFTPMLACTVVSSVADMLEKLTGEITSSQLNIDLNSRLNLIDAAGTGLVDQISAEVVNRGLAIAGETTARNLALTAYSTTSDMNSSISSAVIAAEAVLNGNVATALSSYYTKVAADSATATAITGATASLVSNSALATALSSYYTSAAADSAIATAVTGATTSFGTTLATALSSYYTKTAADSAVATAITGATSSFVTGSSLATSLSSYYTKTAADSAIATAVTGVTSTLNGNIATALISYSTTAVMTTAISGAITTAMSAEMMLKVDVNGNIAGIGLWSSSTTSAVQILANKFSIVDPSNHLTTLVPFVVSGGVVFIASAAIASAAIDTLKIAGNAVTVPLAASNSTAQDMTANRDLVSITVDCSAGSFPAVITVTAVVSVPSTSSMAIIGLQVTVVRNGSTTLASNEGQATLFTIGQSCYQRITFQIIDSSPPASSNTYVVKGAANAISGSPNLSMCSYITTTVSVLGAKR